MISIAIKNGILFILIILIIHFFIKNQTLEKFDDNVVNAANIDEKECVTDTNDSDNDDEKDLLAFLENEDKKNTVDIVQDVIDNIGDNNNVLPRLEINNNQDPLKDLGTFGGGGGVGGLSYSSI